MKCSTALHKTSEAKLLKFHLYYTQTYQIRFFRHILVTIKFKTKLRNNVVMASFLRLKPPNDTISRRFIVLLHKKSQKNILISHLTPTEDIGAMMYDLCLPGPSYHRQIRWWYPTRPCLSGLALNNVRDSGNNPITIPFIQPTF